MMSLRHRPECKSSHCSTALAMAIGSRGRARICARSARPGAGIRQGSPASSIVRTLPFAMSTFPSTITVCAPPRALCTRLERGLSSGRHSGPRVSNNGEIRLLATSIEPSSSSGADRDGAVDGGHLDHLLGRKDEGAQPRRAHRAGAEDSSAAPCRDSCSTSPNCSSAKPSRRWRPSPGNGRTRCRPCRDGSRSRACRRS